MDVMLRSNNLAKTIFVTAGILKEIFVGNCLKIEEPLTVRDIEAARMAQFIVTCVG